MRNWLKQAEVDALGRSGARTEERVELLRIQRENRTPLWMDRDLLKNPSAFFACGSDRAQLPSSFQFFTRRRSISPDRFHTRGLRRSVSR